MKTTLKSLTLSLALSALFLAVTPSTSFSASSNEDLSATEISIVKDTLNEYYEQCSYIDDIIYVTLEFNNNFYIVDCGYQGVFSVSRDLLTIKDID